ncbi:NDST4-like protein [Mya arenaria]|uniref:[heparan sulfate]-glucosamine N-sulfotransferase n=1 Tax=Mya arenaria TaxID=6604 RepID=A0ABY7DH51_MYAAR|nr:NDST4-like protein [Mya arenaria]
MLCPLFFPSNASPSCKTNCGLQTPSDFQLSMARIDILPRTAQRLFCQRRCTLTRALVIVILTVLVVFGILNYRNGHVIRNVDRVTRHPPPTPYTTCNSLHNRPLSNKGPHNHNVQGDLKIGRKVLIVVETPFSRNAKNIAIGMESARFVYKIVEGNKIPTLTHMGKGRFGIVIFETINLYMTLDDWSRQLIDKYCYEFKVGMIFFMKPQNDNGVSMEKFPDFSLTVHYNVGIKEYKLNPDSRVWRITKPGEIVSETFPEGEWAVFHFNHSTFEPLASAIQIASFYDDYEPSAANSNKTVYPAILDKGENDGIRRVFFGQDFSFWLHSLMLLDSISYLSYGMISLSLERYIQIDIDDIFALVESQSRLQESVEGFHFMLGFSGWYYQHGNEEENLGDRTLLVMDQYAVAPHHSGVFPVHDPVYTAWKTVWDIKVLPRQTCGLFTHTYLLDSYPGGPGRLEKSIHGGELFKTFLYNPLNIYMTHLSNYGNDRLALYTFESVIKFVQCWTNLKLKQGTPMDHAIKILVTVRNTWRSGQPTRHVTDFQNSLYLEYFPHPQDKHEYLFEKSAAYFDNILVPKRHMRAHNDPVAVNYTFNEVVSASDSAPREVKALRNRCLLPGEYAHHLERWLDHFSYRQIHIIDGEQLKDNPIGVMDEVQKFLGIEKYLNYTSIVRYDSKKGFYCQVLSDNKNKCLGRSKGRQYNPMDEESEDFLKKYYHKHNTALVQLLGKLKIREPAWLKDYTNTAR